MSKILAQIAGKIVTILGYDGTAFRNILVDELGRLELADMAFRVGLHASTHEDAGDDEINVDGLSGELADDQPALAHLLGGAKHTADSLADLNTKVNDATLDDEGDPRDPNAHAASHQNGGADEISVAGLSGDLADEQDPKDHAANHEYGGGDAPSLAQLGGTMAHFEFIIDGGGAVIERARKPYRDSLALYSFRGMLLLTSRDMS